jgi:two-component system chemotaxis response regulator CheY
MIELVHFNINFGIIIFMESEPKSKPIGVLEGNEKLSLDILAADDSSGNRDLLSMLFDGLGLSAEIVEDGAILLQRLQTKRCKVVVTDQEMPNMTGLQVLQAIRAKEKEGGSSASLPFIIVTGMADFNGDLTELKKNIKNEGNAFYLEKPYKMADLRKLIETLIARSQPQN